MRPFEQDYTAFNNEVNNGATVTFTHPDGAAYDLSVYDRIYFVAKVDPLYPVPNLTLTLALGLDRYASAGQSVVDTLAIDPGNDADGGLAFMLGEYVYEVRGEIDDPQTIEILMRGKFTVEQGIGYASD